MYRLITLGRLSLERGGAPVPDFDVHRRGLAILAILAVEGAVSRDHLMALLWPESDTARARGSLKQALHLLRQFLGTFDLIQGSAVLHLNSERIETDVGRFVAALDRGDLTDAVALYTGPFLDRVHLGGASELEQWIDARRADLGRRWAGAVERLAVGAEEREDLRLAVAWWRRLHEADPADSRLALRLMLALEAAGKRAAALEHAREHQRRLREEWDLPPDSDVDDLAERLRSASRPPRAGPRASPYAEVAGSSTSPPTTTAPATRLHRRRRSWIAAAVGLFGVILAVALVGSQRSHTSRLDPNLIAVFPFRVVSGDTSHGALREGMVDILEAKFSGAGGARVVPARTALAAWRHALGPQRVEMTEEEARGVARRLGAGAAVLGTVVGMPGRLSLNGSLLDSEAGRVRAEAKAEGMPDSLHWLVDRFAAQLAALGAGERADRLASLTSTSLPALYAYLAGKAAHRAGHYDSAVRHLGRALELDSTFARAALAYWGSATWNADPPGMARGVRLALAHRDRLGPRDRVLLEALAAPWDSGGPQPRERIQAWEDAVRQVPDDPELLIQLGDAYFHVGAAAGVEEPFRRAADALTLALALDTTLSIEPMVHLLPIAAMERDTATVRRLVSRIPEDDPGTALYRLEAGAVLGDSAMLAVARPQFDSAGNVGMLLVDARLFGFAIQEAERVMPLYLERSKPGSSRLFSILDFFVFYHELGRPAAAAAALAHLGSREALPPLALRIIISQALYGYVDTAATAQTLVNLGTFTTGPVARDPAAREEQDRSICVMERWRLTRGDTRTARAAIARLAAGGASGCSLVLDAQLAAAEHRPEADAAFGRLDSLLLAGGGRPEWVMELARWREAQGDIAAALRASRRCPQYAPIVNLSYCLREEGRLAALVGDREGAIKAYRHYLALRYNPEPSVTPEVSRVRAELALLVSGSK